MMSVQCPYCSSRNVVPLSGKPASTTAATCIGAVGGAASAIITGMRAIGPVAGPIPFALTTLTQLFLLGIGGAVTGAQIGQKLGADLNTANSNTTFGCCSCNKTFVKPLGLPR